MWLHHSRNHRRKLKPLRKIVACHCNEQVHMTKSSENTSHRQEEHCSHEITKGLLARWCRGLLTSTGKGSQKKTQLRVWEWSAGEAEEVVTTGKRGQSQEQSQTGFKQGWHFELRAVMNNLAASSTDENSHFWAIGTNALSREKVVLAIFYFF